MGTGWRRAFCTSIRRDPLETAASTTPMSALEEKEKRVKQQQQSPSSGGGGRCVKLGMMGGIFSSASSAAAAAEGRGSNPSTPRSGRGGGFDSAPSTPRFRRVNTAASASLPTTPTASAHHSSKKLQCKTMPAAKSDTNASAAESTTTTPTPKSSSSSSKSNHNSDPKNHQQSPRLLLFQSSSSSSPRSPSRFALFKAALRLSRNRCGVCGESARTGSSTSGQTPAVAVFTAECSHVFHFPCISSHVRTHGSLVCPVCSVAWHDVPLLSSSLHLHSPAAAGDSSDHKGARGHGDGGKFEEHVVQSPKLRERGSNGSRGTTTKIYNDDESLQLSPTSCVAGADLLFNSIPEGLEVEEEDDEGDDGLCEDDRDTHDEVGGVPISVIPDSLALVSTGRNHLNYVVSFKVKAPSLPPRPNYSNNKHVSSAAAALVPPGLLDHPSRRAPIDLVTVLDVSGSMMAEKLQMLKRAMRLVISSLGPGDRLSIVAFSMAAAKRLFPLRRMSRSGQRSARQIVNRLVVCGSNQAQGLNQPCSSASCMGDALRKATKVLEDRRERNPVATIMLLSDGHCHGHGHAQQQQEHHHAQQQNVQSHQPPPGTRFTHIEIPIVDVQQKHGIIPNDNNIVPITEEDAFAKRVTGLVSVVLQDVHLQLTIPSVLGEISSVYSYSCGGGCDVGIGQAMLHGEGGKSIHLGDLYAEEERQVLVELKVPKKAVLGGHPMSMSVLCTYTDPLTRSVIRCSEQPFVMPMFLHTQSQNNLVTNSHHRYPPTLLRSSSSSSFPTTTAPAMSTPQQQQQQQHLRSLFVTTRAIVESRRLVDLNDLDTAIHLLSSARSLLLQQPTAVSDTQKALIHSMEAQLEDLRMRQQQQRRRQHHHQPLSPSQRRRSEQPLLGEARGGSGGEQPLTPTSAWRAAEQLAKVAIMRKSLNRVSDLHGLENARF